MIYLTLLCIGILAGFTLLGVKIGHVLGKAGRPVSLDPATEPTPARPQVIVNVPADHKPLEPLTVDGKPALVGPRALLWYSTFVKVMDKDPDVFWAKCAANDAVNTVYGDTYDP